MNYLRARDGLSGGALGLISDQYSMTGMGRRVYSCLTPRGDVLALELFDFGGHPQRFLLRYCLLPERSVADGSARALALRSVDCVPSRGPENAGEGSGYESDRAYKGSVDG